jgi:hypothetical protein
VIGVNVTTIHRFPTQKPLKQVDILSIASPGATGTVVAVTAAGDLAVIREINEHHRLAHEYKDEAKEHAIECGKLLIEMKAKLPYGDFGDWIKKNCTFRSSMAALYMKAAKNPTALEKSPLRSLNMNEERIACKKRRAQEAIKALPNLSKMLPKKMLQKKTTVVEVEETPQPVTIETDVRQEETVGITTEMVAEAMRMMPMMPPYSSVRARVMTARSAVTKFRNKLAAAEKDLVEAEAAVVEAAKELSSRGGVHAGV